MIWVIKLTKMKGTPYVVACDPGQPNRYFEFSFDTLRTTFDIMKAKLFEERDHAKRIADAWPSTGAQVIPVVIKEVSDAPGICRQCKQSFPPEDLVRLVYTFECTECGEAVDGWVCEACYDHDYDADYVSTVQTPAWYAALTNKNGDR